MKPKANIVQFEPPADGGMWMQPREACKYFRHGRGIAPKTLMSKIYAGELKKFAKWTPGGWFVFVTDEMLNNSSKTA